MQLLRPRFTSAALTLALVMFNPLMGSSETTEEETVTVPGYAVHGYADGVRIGYGWYATRGEAEAEREKMLKTETLTGKYYDRVDIIDEPRIIPKSEYLPALKLRPNRRPGDVLKEYRRILTKSRDNVLNLKQSLTSRVEKLSTQQLRDANRLIEQFNQQRAEALQRTGDLFLDIPAIDRITEVEVEPGTDGGGGKDKASLEERRQQLLAERQWLIEENRQIRTEEQTLQPTAASGTKGPYRVVAVMQKAFGGSKTSRGTFQTLQEAQVEVKKFPYAPFTFDDRTTITDGNGRTYDFQEFVKLTAPTADSQKGAQDRRRKLDERRAERDRRLKAYDAARKQFEADVQQSRSSHSAFKPQLNQMPKGSSLPRTRPPR